jgi:transposase
MGIMDSAGIDVGSQELVVTLSRDGQLLRRSFPNTPPGHQAIERWLTADDRITRVCVEATGSYGLDLALVLSRSERVQIMVANPRAVRRFAEALMERNKTDAVDADVLEQFAARMPFQPWVAPSTQALELRTISRRIAALRTVCAAEKNRRHAAGLTQYTPDSVHQSIDRLIETLELEIKDLIKHAQALIRSEPTLKARYDLALTACGIGPLSAILLLGELAHLPPDMDPRQWVAHAGLDPKHHRSGTSVQKKPRISKAGNRFLRHALFMPAMTARSHDPALKAFADHLIQRGKTPLQAIVAVMRKLLTALHAMFRKGQPFSSEKLRPSLSTSP